MPGSPWLEGENPRDHDLVETKDNTIYVVVGNQHPPDSIMCYPKYIPVEHETPWKRRNKYFLRIPSCYEVNHIYEKSRIKPSQVYDARYGVMVLGVKRRDVTRYYDPARRLQEIIRSPKDQLEALVVEVVYQLSRLGVHVDSLGVTGSILLGIHNSSVSDIDLIVYGCREAYSLVEQLGEGGIGELEALRNERLVEWVKCHSRAYRLPGELVKKYYAAWRRLVYRGREVSLTYVNPETSKRFYENVYRYLGPARIIVDVEPWQCGSIYYPSRTLALLERVEKGPSLKEREIEIVSYESLYLKPLVFGGRLLVEGALYQDSYEHLQLLVGVREHRGFIKPLHS